MIKYSYRDICIQPGYSTTYHRKDLDTSVELGDFTFQSPVIPANMACTSSKYWSQQAIDNDYFYVLHRFMDYSDIINFVISPGASGPSEHPTSISVGVNEKDYQLIDALDKHWASPDFITVDVAHGHHSLVRKMIGYIKSRDKLKETFVIAGNIGTVRAAEDLIQWGADAVKVGISMGAACTTYNSTGVGTPMFSTIKDISQAISAPVIADGQVREPGDICKALVAGARMVMIGSLFAACEDAPAEKAWGGYNVFYGSASATNKGHEVPIGSPRVEYDYVEGNDRMLLPRNGKTLLSLHKHFQQHFPV